jgi:transcriptional regulator with XRE-family HTH domain
MKKQSPSDISHKIRRMRGGLSQTEFAKRVGIHRSLISSYESGHKFPSLAALEKLADYEGVTIEYLLGKENAPSHKLTQEEGDFIHLLRNLPPESKSLVLNLLEKLNEHAPSGQNEKTGDLK